MPLVSRPSKPKTDICWDRCRSLVRIAPWAERVESETATHIRTISWPDPDPERSAKYRLSAVGSKRFMRAPLTRIFDLTGLDAADPELQKYSRYFIGQSGLHKVFHSLIPVPEDSLDLQAHEEEIKEDMQFSLDHDLATPGAEDILAIHGILHRGVLDGLTRVAE